MKKYLVQIPKKANKQPRLLTIILNQAWGGSQEQTHEIPVKQLEFQFTLPNEYEYIYRKSSENGFSFDTKITYYNKSKEETIQLVPCDV